MLFLWIIIFFIIGGYIALISSLIQGWKKLPAISLSSADPESLFVSVIIPFRNERPNLPGLLQCLENQTYPSHLYEVIFADDGSQDGGKTWLGEQTSGMAGVKLITSTGHGKKEALLTGVKNAQGKLILTTDADCRFDKEWIACHAEVYITHKPDLIIGPVTMAQGHTDISTFQKLDYLALQTATAGASGTNRPVMCSGANLSYRKGAYLKVQAEVRGKSYLSGDDVFLLHALKQASSKIIYLKNADALVRTRPADSLKDFFIQRVRWGGKSKAYTDKTSIVMALFVFSANLLLAILFIWTLIKPQLFVLWIIPMFAKVLIDWRLLKPGSQFFKIPLKPLPFLMYSFVYPFYIITAATAGFLFSAPWKGRRAATT